MYSESKSYGNFPDTIESKGGYVDPCPAEDRSAEMTSVPDMGLVSKTLVFELLRVNLFIGIATD